MFRRSLLIAGLASVITACGAPTPAPPPVLEATVIGSPITRPLGKYMEKPHESCTFKYQIGKDVRLAVVSSLEYNAGVTTAVNWNFPTCTALEAGDKVFVRGNEIAWDLFTDRNLASSSAAR